MHCTNGRGVIDPTGVLWAGSFPRECGIGVVFVGGVSGPGEETKKPKHPCMFKHQLVV